MLAQQLEEKRKEAQFEQDREIIWLRLVHDALWIHQVINSDPDIADSMVWWMSDFKVTTTSNGFELFICNDLTKQSMTFNQAECARGYLRMGIDSIDAYHIRQEEQLKEELRRDALLHTALSKLTLEEREVLGFMM